ncbi:MAG: GNAT family N-acetyltransferase [Planctomycetota bacterium]|nr:GNAT family N-acetyltransferase [Planctomycetota bacterium]
MRTEFPRTPKQRAAVAEMCASVFAPAYEDLVALFGRDLELDPAFKPQYSRFVRRKGRVAAHVGLFERTVRIGRARFRMAGIGSVTCRKEFRGQNLPSVCMDDALAVARKEGIPLSFLLCGERLSGFYTRFGYTEVMPRSSLRIPAKALAELKNPFAVRAYRKADAEALAKLYNAAAAGTPGSVVRDATRFHFGVLREDLLAASKADQQGRVRVFTVEGSKAPRGYVAARDGGLLEAFVAPGDAEAAAGVLAWLRDYLGGKEIELANYADTHPLAAFAQRFPHTYETGMRWSWGAMGLILDVAGILDLLKPELEARINREGIESEGHLHLIVDGKDHSLILGRAHHISLMISTHRHILSARVECSKQALLQMALGTLPWTAIPGVKVDGDQALLGAVFPQAQPRLYRLDYF